MDRIKVYAKYVLWIVLFIVLSEFLIAVGLNSVYKNIQRRDGNTQVSIYQAEASNSNGRIRGIVKNSNPEELSGKYIKIDFYSSRNIFLGKKYIAIENLEKDQVQSFEVFFKLKHVASYEISITNEKEEQEIKEIPEKYRLPGMIGIILVGLYVLW